MHLTSLGFWGSTLQAPKSTLRLQHCQDHHAEIVLRQSFINTNTVFTRSSAYPRICISMNDEILYFPAKRGGWRRYRDATAPGESMNLSLLPGLLLRLFCFGLCIRLSDGVRIQSMLVAIVLDWHLPVPPGPVHRIDIGIEEDLVEVPHHNRQSGQNRLVEMDGRGHINPPARQQISSRYVGPQHHAGNRHQRRAPPQCPVLSLLRIVEAAELRLFAAQAKVITHRP